MSSVEVFVRWPHFLKVGNLLALTYRRISVELIKWYERLKLLSCWCLYMVLWYSMHVQIYKAPLNKDAEVVHCHKYALFSAFYTNSYLLPSIIIPISITNLFFISILGKFQVCYKNEIKCYITFYFFSQLNIIWLKVRN